MCKVTQFFNSKKVGVDAVDEVFFLFHYIWNISVNRHLRCDSHQVISHLFEKT